MCKKLDMKCIEVNGVEMFGPENGIWVVCECEKSLEI